VIESTLEQGAESIEEIKRKFYGVAVGRVINPLDPLLLGRVQVQLPFIDSLDLSPWCRVATMMAGPISGTYFIPNIGDEVLVAFEHGDVQAPYIIGSLWSAMAPPPLPSPIPQIREIRTLVGNTIMFMEVPPGILIMSATGQTILMSPAGIQIVAEANLINMTPDGVTIVGPVVNIVGQTAVNITAPTVNVTGAAATNIQSGGLASVKAPVVMIN